MGLPEIPNYSERQKFNLQWQIATMGILAGSTDEKRLIDHFTKPQTRLDELSFARAFAQLVNADIADPQVNGFVEETTTTVPPFPHHQRLELRFGLDSEEYTLSRRLFKNPHRIEGNNLSFEKYIGKVYNPKKKTWEDKNYYHLSYQAGQGHVPSERWLGLLGGQVLFVSKIESTNILGTKPSTKRDARTT